MKTKIIWWLYFFLLCSCSGKILGANYNSHQSHNSTVAGRTKVVHKEDMRMKKAMIRARKKAVKDLPKAKKVRKKKGRKYVN
jgi:hypothetical protein